MAENGSFANSSGNRPFGNQNNPLELLQQIFQSGGGGIILWIVGGIFVIFLIGGMVFTVSPEEVAVITRFGKHVRTESSGLQWKLPLGIERKYMVPVERQEKQEFGFRTSEAGIQTRYDSRSYNEESLMLTGDLNAAEVEWIVQYRIIDPYKYLFRVRNPVQTFRDVNESVMREVVGDRTVNEVLTIGREEVADLAQKDIQFLCNQYDLGIRVEQVALQGVNPPDEVKPAFNEVNEAQQEREKLINQAMAEYNKVVSKAEGNASRVIEESRGYALERVNRAKGDTALFNSVFKEYSRSREVTRKRMHLEALQDVLSRAGKKVIISPDLKGILPLLGSIGGKEVNQ